MPISRELAISAITYLGNNLSLEHDNPDFELWHQISGEDPADFYVQYFGTGEGIGLTTEEAYYEAVESIYMRALTWGKALPGTYILPIQEEQRSAFNNANPTDVIKYLFPKAEEQDIAMLTSAISSGKVEAASVAKVAGLAYVADTSPSAGGIVDLAQLYEYGYGPTSNQLDNIFTTLSPSPYYGFGGTGIDTVKVSGNSHDFNIVITKNKTAIVSNDGESQFLYSGIERFEFNDNAVAVDTEGNAGQAYRLYKAAFDRAPDKSGLGYWINEMDHGTSLQGVAQSFVDSQEFQNLNGANPTDLDLASSLYQHVLGRAPDKAGLDYWVAQLDTHALKPNELLASFSESYENKVAISGQIENGIEYNMI